MADERAAAASRQAMDETLLVDLSNAATSVGSEVDGIAEDVQRLKLLRDRLRSLSRTMDSIRKQRDELQGSLNVLQQHAAARDRMHETTIVELREQIAQVYCPILRHG